MSGVVFEDSSISHGNEAYEFEQPLSETSAAIRRWKWAEDSVLYNKSPYVPPREIFQAVCDELGRYYSQTMGAKYTRSNRKIKLKFERVLCELGLWSSNSNIRGEWVNLEIVTSVYALDKTDMEKKGLLYINIRPKNFNVYGIDSDLFFKIIDYIDGKLELVKSFDTADGIREYCGEEKFLNAHNNNKIYFGRDSTLE